MGGYPNPCTEHQSSQLLEVIFGSYSVLSPSFIAELAINICFSFKCLSPNYCSYSMKLLPLEYWTCFQILGVSEP